MMYTVLKEKIYDFFDAVSKNQKLYLPSDVKEDSANFVKYENGVKLSSALKTVCSAKDFFFPKTECLVKYVKEGKAFKVEDPRSEVEDFVIFGVRACDASSFGVIDNVYLKQEPVDSYYKNRRDHSTVIVLACNNPERTCFCSSYKIDASLSFKPSGADIACWESGGKYFFEEVTEKGKKLLESISVFETSGAGESTDETSDEKEVLKIKEEIKEKINALPFANLDFSKIEKTPMLDLFNLKIWDKVSESCLGCGTCTYVCPTCMCFDVRDFDNGKNIEQVRCWDSCMYSDFTQMAAANPRTSQKERSRQRFMHKLKYYPDVYNGMYACVGCGRCLESCPVNMNIVKVIKMIQETE